jgi:hypothetical protein
MMLQADFEFQPHGAVWLVMPLSARATAWLRAHVVTTETQSFGSAVICESKYVEGVHAGVLASGFVVAVHRPAPQH